MKKLALVLFVAMALGTAFSTVASGQYELEQAFKKAALPTDAKGRWVVKTDVNIYKLDGTMKFEASGNLELKGNVLEGNLNLRPPGGAFINGNTMYLYLTKPSPSTIRVRHDIAGKPFLGRPAEILKLETRYRAPFLRGKAVWDGEECTISIFFSPQQTTEKPKPAFPDPDPIPSAPAEAEFLDNAFKRAATPATWNVTARVTMNAQGKEFISASGKVMSQSLISIGGDLPLSLNNKAIPDGTLRINIRKGAQAVVEITRMFAGKPSLGRPATIVTLPIDPNFNYLSGPIQWSDGNRVIRIDLETEPVGPKKPIGARYQVTGYMKVTNAEDGLFGADNTCEIYGNIWIKLVDKDNKDYGSRKVFTLVPQDAMKGFKL